MFQPAVSRHELLTMSFALTLGLPDLAATEALGRRLAALARTGDIFALAGSLGSGKTALARAFVRALTSDSEEVPSPTFTLLQSYDSGRGPLFHFDLYRLDHPDQAVELGLDDAFTDGISLIEWPERLGALLPGRHLRIALSAGAGESGRIATLQGGESWTQRWR
jgi:tRNA threonylcarbamoyladenosine biosynthesis protein TsaE